MTSALLINKAPKPVLALARTRFFLQGEKVLASGKQVCLPCPLALFTTQLIHISTRGAASMHSLWAEGSTGSLTAPLETGLNKEPELVNYPQEPLRHSRRCQHTHAPLLSVGGATAASWICMTHPPTRTAVISPGSCSEPAWGRICQSPCLKQMSKWERSGTAGGGESDVIVVLQQRCWSCWGWLAGRQAPSLTLHVWQNVSWMIKWWNSSIWAAVPVPGVLRGQRQRGAVCLALDTDAQIVYLIGININIFT